MNNVEENKIQLNGNENESTESTKKLSTFNSQLSTLNPDEIIYVPAENILAIEGVIKSWEAVKTKWRKMRMD